LGFLAAWLIALSTSRFLCKFVSLKFFQKRELRAQTSTRQIWTTARICWSLPHPKILLW